MSNSSDEQKAIEDTHPDKDAESKEDEELDNLLDEALEGFDKPVSIPKVKEEKKESTVPESDVIWSEEFMKQASVEFEKSIRMMMAESGASGNDPQFAESLIKASQEAAAKVFENQPDGGASFAETLRHLAENTESLQAEPDEAMLAKMLESMAFGSGGSSTGEGVSGDMGNLGDILPAMQGMLQSLLSKELLYPSIKEIVVKYPDWLADNRAKLEADQFDKYNRQFAIMQQVCTEFESEKDDDDSTTKNNRFEKILSLMQRMQECGHPPKELAGEAEVLQNPFGGVESVPTSGPGAENCVVM